MGALRGVLAYLLVLLVQVVAAVQEAVAPSHPLLLHQALEAPQGAAVGVEHQLDQAGDDAAQVRAALL